jgi:2-succinyl-5-enolpyruvyl-6-hydroxy-3-cyclohexene-1-carboxylate synthase
MRALVDEWVRAGVSDVFLSPGSRSTPLALAVAERLRVHVVLDERSAAFFGLGYGKQAGRPAVLVCTSGTAAAHYYPAVKEADLSAVPMIVATADRPPELRNTGAPQSMDQQQLYGSAVRWFVDPGVPEAYPGATRFWRSLGARSVAEATGAQPGPVHVNLPFREPFLSDEPPADVPGRPGGEPWVVPVVSEPGPDRETVARFVAAVGDAERGVIVLGQDPGVDPAAVARFAAATGWPVFADPLSGLRTVDTITTYDAVLRSPVFAERHRPDVALRLGRPATSKALGAWLTADVAQVTIASTLAWLDPHRTTSLVIAADPTRLLDAASDDIHRGAHEWLGSWMGAEAAARVAMDAALDMPQELTEPRIARDVVEAMPDGTVLLLGSSMPVRDAESFAAGRHGIEMRSNRGVNGIDGMISTALGMGVSGVPVGALVGDIGFLHDANGLLGASDRGVDATLVVVDNDGGGIFSFLPQAGHERFEELFGTPHGVDIAAVAAAHGVPVAAPTHPDDVGLAVREAAAAGGVRLVHLRTDRQANVAAHQAIWDAVAAAVT